MIASTEHATQASATMVSISRFNKDTVRYAHIWLVPLIRESPSLASRITGVSPELDSASALLILTHPESVRFIQSPSPIIPIVICDNGARSPEAPREPILGTTGAIPWFTIASIRSTISGRAPDTPLASEFALYIIMSNTYSGRIGLPTPHAWLRTRLACSSSSSDLSMRTDDSAPNPVLMP